jgi:tetratricopeptide (TPR) repeat protein
MGRYNEAKEWLEKALNNGGDSNGVILEHYGDVWFKLGNTTEALKYWKEALEKGGASKMIQRKIDEKKYIESNE